LDTKKIFDSSREKPYTLCHGDQHINNMLFNGGMKGRGGRKRKEGDAGRRASLIFHR
jgi:hypothetical protein